MTIIPSCPRFRLVMSIAATNVAHHSPQVCFRKSVTREEFRRSRQARRAQLSTLFQQPTVLLSTAEFRESWVTVGSLQTPHLARVDLKLPNHLLKPCMADAQLLSPGATGWFAPRPVVHTNTYLRIMSDSSLLRQGFRPNPLFCYLRSGLFRCPRERIAEKGGLRAGLLCWRFENFHQRRAENSEQYAERFSACGFNSLTAALGMGFWNTRRAFGSLSKTRSSRSGPLRSSAAIRRIFFHVETGSDSIATCSVQSWILLRANWSRSASVWEKRSAGLFR